MVAIAGLVWVPGTVVRTKLVVKIAIVGVVLLSDSVLVLMSVVVRLSSVAVVLDGVPTVTASSAMSVSGGSDVPLGPKGPGGRGMVVTFGAGCVGTNGKEVVVLESAWEDSGVTLPVAEGLILGGKRAVPLNRVSETVGVMSH